MATNGRDLTIRQRRAISALLSTRTVNAAAKRAKVGERTLHRWIAEDEAFVLALREAEAGVVDDATRQLLTLQGAAISVFARLMEGSDVSPAVRLRAAQTVLEYALRLRESRDFEERLERLENQLAGR